MQSQDIPAARRITRLAPSPTGALHLGNARTFLINWLLARQNGWHVALRIEDLDGPRVQPNADARLIDDLRWLGLDWDGGPTYQSSRAGIYAAAVERLLNARLAYACTCSRKEALLASSAPHLEDGGFVYPGTCRDRYGSLDEARRASGKSPAVRFRVADRDLQFADAFRGPQRVNLARDSGDFIIQKADGTAAYQLAVVIDDAEAGVTDVVRGDDLLDSAAKQIALYDALGLSRQPAYTHVPLLVGPDGMRLAKRHGDARIESYRAAGVPPARVLALLARWCNIALDATEQDNLATRDLIGRFDLSRLDRSPIVVRPEDVQL